MLPFFGYPAIPSGIRDEQCPFFLAGNRLNQRHLKGCLILKLCCCITTIHIPHDPIRNGPTSQSGHTLYLADVIVPGAKEEVADFLEEKMQKD